MGLQSTCLQRCPWSTGGGLWGSHRGSVEFEGSHRGSGGRGLLGLKAQRKALLRCMETGLCRSMEQGSAAGTRISQLRWLGESVLGSRGGKAPC